jgi:hypothetical protein
LLKRAGPVKFGSIPDLFQWQIYFNPDLFRAS